MNRRLFIKRLFILGSIGILNNSSALARSEKTSVLHGPLAGSVYYTAEAPGRWHKKVSGHLPSIEKSENKIEVTTGHEMRGFEHYIVKHTIFDENFILLSEKMFDPSRDIPVSTHDISGIKNIIFAMSVCNKHDAWLNALEI